AIVSEPGPKKPTTVTPLAVTVEPAPVTIMLPATRMSVVCSVPPLVTASVPPSISTKLPTVNDPPLMVSPPDPKPLTTVRVPPMLLLPVSVSWPLPSSTRLPRAPPSWIEPLSVVERSLLPTVSSFDPIEYVPAPSIEPAVILPLLSGPDVPEKSTVPPALVMKRALPPLLLLVNCVSAPPLVVMVALLAVLVSENERRVRKPLVMMVELPAELEPRKDMLPLLVIAAFAAVPLLKNIRALLVKLGANAEVLAIPAPLMLKVKKGLIKKGLVVNEYAGAAAVNWIVLIEVEVEMVTDVRVLVSNVAVPSGTSGFEVQLVTRVHSAFVTPVQVPSVACAALGLSVASAPSQTLPSSAARLKVARVAAAVTRIAPPRRAARGAAPAAARVACERHRYERIPQPLRAAPAAHRNHRPRVPRERIV